MGAGGPEPRHPELRDPGHRGLRILRQLQHHRGLRQWWHDAADHAAPHQHAADHAAPEQRRQRLLGDLHQLLRLGRRLHGRGERQERRLGRHQRLDGEADLPRQPDRHQPVEWQLHPVRQHGDRDQCRLQRRRGSRRRHLLRVQRQLLGQQRRSDRHLHRELTPLRHG
ncbi:hypothetical protein SCOCK_80117 [Actinacidiphila cocklensis]|uniref:Uncharacterized protein n=1 Tax=Actinacidiphila cocklensis TaxID=887465 RepID=A0A9W4E3W9_9ACTN|nr:hypothetical protein SCOCK_80117 [Actinacidiphila cocklensis]